jgi:hypothetical protein
MHHAIPGNTHAIIRTDTSYIMLSLYIPQLHFLQSLIKFLPHMMTYRNGTVLTAKNFTTTSLNKTVAEIQKS